MFLRIVEMITDMIQRGVPLHMKRNKYVKRVLFALLILILSFSVISMAVTVIFFHTAFPRSDTPGEFSYSYSQMEEEGYSYQKVKFPSGNNILTGYFFAPDEPAALVVIAAGFGDGGTSHLAEMKSFVDSGYAVLCYDATGVGESEGSGQGGLSQPALDLDAALRFTADDDRSSTLPILLYGHSAGGYAVATCLGHDCVKAAVIISGFDHPVQLMRESARPYVGLLADAEYPFLLLENQLVFGNSQKASVCISNASKPVAVFEGINDERVPRSQRLSTTLKDADQTNISISLCDEALRDGHSGLWLSTDALNYRANHQGDTTVDPEKSNALDREFISTVLAFYQSLLND